jgi:hypothetical protein
MTIQTNTEDSTRKDTKLMKELMDRISEDSKALNTLKQKYRDRSEGKAVLFGSAWDYFINVASKQKVKPILNTKNVRELLTFMKINKIKIEGAPKTYRQCWKKQNERKREVTIWPKPSS